MRSGHVSAEHGPIRLTSMLQVGCPEWLVEDETRDASWSGDGWQPTFRWQNLCGWLPGTSCNASLECSGGKVCIQCQYSSPSRPAWGNVTSVTMGGCYGKPGPLAPLWHFTLSLPSILAGRVNRE